MLKYIRLIQKINENIVKLENNFLILIQEGMI